MALNESGYTLVTLPDPEPEFLTTFGDLVLDPYCGGKQRYRRFDQYRIHYENGRWHLKLLPHRPFIQSQKYNKFAGGILREFEPLKIDPSIYVDACAKAIPLDTTKEWQINVHQCRVIVNPDIRGVSVPEGPHQDGHEYTAILVFKRHEITGAITSLYPVKSREPFYTTVIPENHALVFSDERMFHYTTDLIPLNGRGHRDLWMIVFDQWEDANNTENKRYGEAYEQEAMIEQ